jgi:hypothetical protein
MKKLIKIFVKHFIKWKFFFSIGKEKNSSISVRLMKKKCADETFCVGKKREWRVFQSGLPDFSWSNVPKRGKIYQNCNIIYQNCHKTYQIISKFTKLPQNIPNYHKILQSITKYSEIPQNIPNYYKICIPNYHKIYQMAVKYIKWP